MLVEIILGAVGEAALAYAGSKGSDLFKSAKAKKEIAEIGARSIEAGIAKAPALANDLRSESFAKGVLVPVLETLIVDPSKLPDPDGLASEFISMFVRRFAGEDSADETLNRIFQTEPTELSILQEQAKKDEDPHIWSFLLCWQSDWLYWADRDRVQALLRTLWEKDERIFQSVELVGVLWKNRPIFPDDLLIEIITAWFETEEEPFTQAAAEYTQAISLVYPDNVAGQKLSAHLTETASWQLTGQLFTAASAWRDGDAVLRPLAHQLLMKFASDAAGGQAHAISSAVDKRDTLLADDLTRELVNAVAENQELLAASLTGRFADGLQSLLLYPDFDEPVMHVTERIAELIVDKKGGQHRGFIDKDFVQVSIALQRNDGPLRARAMDVYEKLLDAGAYGAEEAAKDSLSRL